jgi:hypothetical protein
MIEQCPHPRPTAANVRSTEGLLYFIWEREAIRLARENDLPAPWTTDPIFAKYKFTNIHRRDDRVTRWIIEHLITPSNQDHNLWFTLLIARLINWPPTLQKLRAARVIPCGPNPLHPGVMFDPAAFVKVVEAAKLIQEKTYSGAYMVYPTKKAPGGLKSEALARYIIGDVVKNVDNIYDSLWCTPEPSIETFVAALSSCFGISTFMAGQVAADLTYTPQHLGGAVDLFTYAPIGPGSSRGLNYLLRRAPFATWSQGAFNAELIRLRLEIIEQLHITDMTLHDVQNCMCEFSKYCRTLLGEGVPKSTYKPETEF